MEVERLSVDRCRVDFEISRVDDYADGRADRERDAVNRAVGYVQVLDLERPERRRIARRDLVQLGRIEQSVLLELLSYERKRELRPIHRHVEVAQDVRDRADMIFVPVRQDDRANHPLVLLQVGDVRDHDVHAEQLLLGKHQPRVDHDDVVARAQREHVHAELAQPAQRNGPQRRCAQVSVGSQDFTGIVSHSAMRLAAGLPNRAGIG